MRTVGSDADSRRHMPTVYAIAASRCETLPVFLICDRIWPKPRGALISGRWPGSRCVAAWLRRRDLQRRHRLRHASGGGRCGLERFGTRACPGSSTCNGLWAVYNVSCYDVAACDGLAVLLGRSDRGFRGKIRAKKLRAMAESEARQARLSYGIGAAGDLPAHGAEPQSGSGADENLPSGSRLARRPAAIFAKAAGQAGLISGGS